jgi:hypothetical protein
VPVVWIIPLIFSREYILSLSDNASSFMHTFTTHLSALFLMSVLNVLISYEQTYMTSEDSFGEQIPFCEPYWYQGYYSPYYREV